MYERLSADPPTKTWKQEVSFLESNEINLLYARTLDNINTCLGIQILLNLSICNHLQMVLLQPPPTKLAIHATIADLKSDLLIPHHIC